MRSIPTDEEFEDFLHFVGRCDASEDAMESRSLSRVAIPAYTSADPMLRAYTPEGWKQFKVAFAAFSGDAVTGFLYAREEDGRLRPFSVSYMGADSGVRRALEVTNVLSAARPDHELRILDVKPLGWPFFWLAGPDPVFVCWHGARAFAQAEVSEQLASWRKARCGD